MKSCTINVIILKFNDILLVIGGCGGGGGGDAGGGHGCKEW